MSDWYEARTTRTYRIICQACWPASGRGCSGTGPWAGSPSEAADLAREAGWEIIDGRWVCPAHQEAYSEEDVVQNASCPRCGAPVVWHSPDRELRCTRPGCLGPRL